MMVDMKTELSYVTQTFSCVPFFNSLHVHVLAANDGAMHSMLYVFVKLSVAFVRVCCDDGITM